MALAKGCLSEQECNREMVPTLGQGVTGRWHHHGAGCNGEMVPSVGQGVSMGSFEFCPQASLLLTTVFSCSIICKMEVGAGLDG